MKSLTHDGSRLEEIVPMPCFQPTPWRGRTAMAPQLPAARRALIARLIYVACTTLRRLYRRKHRRDHE